MRVGEYRDTLPLWQSGDFTIRFVPDRFVGRALVHCHMIPHVDLGMALVVGLVDSNTTSVGGGAFQPPSPPAAKWSIGK